MFILLCMLFRHNSKLLHLQGLLFDILPKRKCFYQTYYHRSSFYCYQITKFVLFPFSFRNSFKRFIISAILIYRFKYKKYIWIIIGLSVLSYGNRIKNEYFFYCIINSLLVISIIIFPIVRDFSAYSCAFII